MAWPARKHQFLATILPRSVCWHCSWFLNLFLFCWIEYLFRWFDLFLMSVWNFSVTIRCSSSNSTRFGYCPSDLSTRYELFVYNSNRLIAVVRLRRDPFTAQALCVIGLTTICNNSLPALDLPSWEHSSSWRTVGDCCKWCNTEHGNWCGWALCTKRIANAYGQLSATVASMERCDHSFCDWISSIWMKINKVDRLTIDLSLIWLERKKERENGWGVSCLLRPWHVWPSGALFEAPVVGATRSRRCWRENKKWFGILDIGFG